jgi:hydrogenase nickel incorporation protein HypA/HybF
MHEFKLVEDMVKVLEKEVASPEVGEVKTIHLEVGKLKYVVPDIMESSFEHVPKSEKLKNAKIKIEEIPVKIKCSKCDDERVVDNGDYFCESCDSGATQVISGKEFTIKGIEW